MKRPGILLLWIARALFVIAVALELFGVALFLSFGLWSEEALHATRQALAGVTVVALGMVALGFWVRRRYHLMQHVGDATAE
jgi:hypothetical protein